MTKRAIKRSASFATIISASGLAFALISTLFFRVGIFRVALFTGILAYVLLLPGNMLIYWIVSAGHPNLPVSVPAYLAAPASLVAYFGLSWFFHFVYYKTRKPSGSDEAGRT
jgi:hypothetical protein